MKEQVIKLGKCLFDLGIATTNDGQPPNDYQYCNMGLCMLMLFCVYKLIQKGEEE